ncbi:MAG TPA: adenylate/guanylate cyclase domain-containing protein [Acidimicrobiales bacterium]|nr:adenylate/guanylate cyclase domain-containing protein [Acidimicrobiales bacterium]
MRTEEPPAGIVTFVFTDVEGSTRLLRRLGDRYGPLLDRHLELMDEAWERYGGWVVETTGDGVFVAFADAAAAVHACADAQRRLGAEPWPEDAVLRARMGIHSGLAAPHDGSYRALAVHQAARVMSAAHGGQVILTDATEERISRLDGVALVPLGHFRVRDFDEPVRLHQLAGPGLADTFPAVRAVPSDGHNLVAPPTSFRGREREMREVGDAIRPGGLLTVVGPGGVGKTRLSVEIGLRQAASWPDGTWLIDLSPLDDADLLASAVGAALGVPSRGDDRWAEVVEHLRSQQALIILDNCERHLEACARLADDLLRRCPGCAVLATSRAPLGAAAERLHRLEPLPVPSAESPGPAVELFLDRVRAVRPGFEPAAGDDRVIADICRRLDGLPLALELAAARLSALSPVELRDGLRDRFAVLRSRNVALPERQRTLESLLDWSDRALAPAERGALRRLSVFGGGFSLPAAAAAIGTPDAPELVWSLVEKSLVATDLTANATRYRLLDSVREYAAARLAADGEAEPTARRLARWYRDRIGGARRHDPSWSSETGAELDNLRALVPLVAPVEPELGQELAYVIARQLDSVQRFREAIAELERHVTMLQSATPEGVSLRTTLADLHLRVGEAAAAKLALADAEALFAAVGSLPSWDEIALDRTRGDLACRTGDFFTALDSARQALRDELSRPARARMLSQVGIAALSLGYLDDAWAAFEEQLAVAVELGDPVLEAPARSNLAEIALRRGDLVAAARHQRRSMGLGLELGAPVMVAFGLIVAARLLGARGGWADAVRLHAHADVVLERTGLVLYDEDRKASDELAARALASLGADRYGAAMSAGRAMELPDAASLADRVLSEVETGTVTAAGGTGPAAGITARSDP